MKSIVLGTISLDRMAGGLEKNIVLLANHLARRGHRVSLVTFDQPNANPFYEIEPRVQWHRVGRTRPHFSISFRSRLALIGRIRAVLRAMDRPIVVCFHHGILPRFYLASRLMGLPLVCSERNSLTLYQHIRQAKWSLGFMMLGLTDRITVQFPAYVQEYPWWLRRRIRVIPNPVHAAQQQATPNLAGPEGRFRLLTVGRLCAQKDQKLLIDAFAQICAQHPQWDLHILGDGEAHDELSAHIQAHGLAGRVFLEGKQRNVSAWLAGSHLFCMLSKWEGFPNALAEAMVHGLPCVGLKSCAGVRDLIADGITGLLVTETDLARTLGDLMNSPGTRMEMGKASLTLISQYQPQHAFRLWDDLLVEIDAAR